MPKESVKSITRIYYSNPKVQKALFEFSQDREVVPSYNMESFGKRPDTFQYPGDIMAAVKKGATSFHASEEIWKNPLELDSESSIEDLEYLRKSWDLLIDVDSPYLDSSKVATSLLIKALEKHGVKSYSIKFSGSKGFHILVPGKAFPEEFEGQKFKESFPEWPRAVCEFLMHEIKSEYNKAVSDWDINFQALEARTKLSREDVTSIKCPECNSDAEKTNLVTLKCNRCKNIQQRPSLKITKRKLKCIEPSCPGEYYIEKEEELFKCKKCGYTSFDKTSFKSRNITTHSKEARRAFSSEFKEEVSGSALGSLDLVLVASRHLFRMPYSLHEKTGLSSIVISKSEIPNFHPRDANPMKVKIKPFYPKAEEGEATKLLELALKWKKLQVRHQEEETRKKYKDMKFEEVNLSDVKESQFPVPIKTLLKGLKDGRKRGLFVLLTFLKSIGYSPEKINETCRGWNKKNSPPLKEGYLKSQIDWHIKQKRRILPPNYSNQSFYKDLKLFEKQPKEKNPLSELIRKSKNRR